MELRFLVTSQQDENAIFQLRTHDEFRFETTPYKADADLPNLPSKKATL